MVEQHAKALVPEIRFAGFTDPWEQRKVGDFLSESRVKGNTGLNSRKLTVKLWGKGVIEKNDFGGSEHTQYFIRHKGQFIYSKLDFLNSAFGVIPEKLDGYESTADLPAFDLVEMNPHFMFFTAVQEGFYLKHGSAADGSRKAKRIHVNTFLEMPIMVPTVAEQDFIVEYLQSLDCLITLHQRKYDKLCVLKKSMLDKMFPKGGSVYPEIRFAGFTDPWEQRKLGEVAYGFEYGLNAAASDFDGEKKYLRITDIDDQTREFRTDDLSSPDINNPIDDKYLLKEGDILFARTGASVGKTYLYKASDGKTYYAGFLIRAHVSDEADAGFIFQSALTERYKQFVLITSQRSGQPGINAQEYADLLLLLPSLPEQRRIGAFFDRLDSLITLHQRKLELLRNIKKSMLDKMFV